MQRAVSSVVRNCVRHLTSSTVLTGSRPTPKSLSGFGKKKSNRKSYDDEEAQDELFHPPKPKTVPPSDLPPSMRKKYRIFTDQSEEIIDSNQALWVEIEAPEEPEVDQFVGLNMERGVTGVLDIEDLIHVLRLENAQNICTIKIPPEIMYADYLVVCTGTSKRQLLAMAEFVRKYYKAKKLPEDPFLENSLGIKDWNTSWIALDLGNIVVHFMDAKTREFYDLEALWALGPEHDPKCAGDADPMLELLRQSSSEAGDLFGTQRKTRDGAKTT
ncbi:uncharacterized protein LOC129594680 [Paramacrobiotus metropolitanus]|uniref:uncharacterized protein LOC129594680 n=1 Tax=Paramacrobiotus metropolitanus TaxID=2943436 RepID=UPI0024464206|nr:uncharacterized protein LOC129594680 [Paramacrobiotus metropolitanus]